ncbi:MAG TPA: ABC transporter substrate-binding protein [Candidatus Kapabacteria bacterium]|nr:ABC transporter substrate-binding protein [Candidatus Kapabacteria bacterium]
MKKILSIILLGAISMYGCGKKEGGSAGDYGLSKKNNVVWWQLSDIQRLNPYTSTDANAAYVQQEIWEALNFQNPRTLELMPGLASLPEISADHLTYTYTMNPAAHWSDGKPLTSEDVIFCFKAAMNPKVINSQQLRNYLLTIDSVYNPGGDKSKVEFHLSKPYYAADQVLGGGYVLILPKHILDPKNLTDKCSWADLHNPTTKNPAVAEFATWFETPEIGRDPKYQIGSGPYVYKEWVTFSHITLKKDPNYWAKDMVWHESYPDELMYKTINDQNAALVALKGKELDLIDVLKPDQYVNQMDTTKQPFLSKAILFYNAYTFIGWNNLNPLFSDKKVRRALTMLVDRPKIIHSIMKDITKPNDGPIMWTQPNYDSTIHQVGYNPDEAKKLLKEAGWEDTDGDGILDKVINGKKTPFKFVFQVNAGNEVRKQVLLVIAEELRKAGIDANVTTFEWSVFLENTRNHNYDAAYGAWAGNASEDDIYQLWHSSQSKNKGSNWVSFRNDEADQIMADTRTEFDKTKRYAMAKRLQEIFQEENPVTFLFAGPNYMGYQKRFDNVEFYHQRPCFDLRYWSIKGSGVSPKAGSPSTIKMVQ